MERAAAAKDNDLEALLERVQEGRDADLGSYRSSTLGRRIKRRMNAVGVEDYETYGDYLEANPGEFSELFNALMITVTSFFRDPESWDYLATEIVPRILEAVPEEDQIRIWSAGCATGEEAYTVAMVMLEAMGEEQFKRRVKLFATDVDAEALAKARAAVYPPEALEDVPADLAKRYFVERDGNVAFLPDLRRSVIFGRNELREDAPISRIDLLVCRNVLMYFTVDAQARILSQFNFALRNHGYLFLGNSEILTRHPQFFYPVDAGRHVFRRSARARFGDRMTETLDARRTVSEPDKQRRYADLRQAAYAISPIALVIVDAANTVIDANDLARDLFSIETVDIGRPFQDLEFSYQPLELRGPLGRAIENAESLKIGRVELGDENDRRTYEAEITPVTVEDTAPEGAVITFTDVTDYARLVADYAKSKRELESAFEELQSTVEELEMTNEELQSSNEELETTNEELQSANEELQTANEELASTGDALASASREHRASSNELKRLQMFVDGILSNLDNDVLVVDDDGRIRLWNDSAQGLWGLREEDIEGTDLFSLEIGLPVEELRKPLEEALSEERRKASLALAAVDRRGRKIECEVRIIPFVQADGGSIGILLMREVNKGSGAA